MAAQEDLLYVPEAFVPPTEVDARALQDMVGYLERELLRISLTFEQGPARTVEFQHVVPARPREGQIVGADGTNWDPGYGQNMYGYWNSTWNPLGLTGVSATLLNLTDPNANLLVVWDDANSTFAWNSTTVEVDDLYLAAGGLVNWNNGASLIYENSNSLVYQAASSGTHAFVSQSATQFVVTGTVSAVNYVSVTGSAAGTTVYVGAGGSDTNIDTTLYGKGAGGVFIGSGKGTIAQFVSNATSNYNYLQVIGVATGGSVTTVATGSDTNVSWTLSLKGAGAFNFYTGNGSYRQFAISHFASAVNYIGASGNTTGGRPYLYATGSDTDVGFQFSAQGTGGFYFYTGSNNYLQLVIAHTASTVNYPQVSGASTGNAPYIYWTGSDSAVQGFYYTKGSGGHHFRTHADSTPVLQFYVAPVASAVNYVQVSGAVTAGSPYIFATGSDSNVAFNYYTKGTGGHHFFSAADSSPTRQFVIAHTASAVNYWQFSGAVASGNLYLTAAGASSNVGLDINTKGTSPVILTSAYVRVRDITANRYRTDLSVASGGATRSVYDDTGTTYLPYLVQASSLTVQTGTTGSLASQFVVSHTASAVNYWEFTGAATSGGITCYASGSDTNIPITFVSKGTGAITLYGNGGSQFVVSPTASAVNYIQATGSATSGVPTLSAVGADTHVEFGVAPKGSGSFRVTCLGDDSGGGMIYSFSTKSSGSAYHLDLYYSGFSPDDNTSWFMHGHDSTTSRAICYSDGDWYNHDGTYGTISDPKFKQNVTPATSQWEDVKALAKTMINYETKFSPGKRMLGVDASVVRNISPGIVHDGVWGDEPAMLVDTMTMHAKGFKALGEALERIEQLEAEVAALKGA